MDYNHLFSTKMDELLLEEMNLTNTPGTALSIIDQSKIALQRTYGARDFETSTPVNEHTLFCVASVTKSFICAGILKLQEQGKLNINDPISQYVPVSIGFEDQPITVHHLMSHQSGIPDLTDSMWWRNKEAELGLSSAVPKYPFTSWDDGFRFLNGSQEFVSKPGQRFHYNNFGYGLLSKIITEVANENFKKYLDKVLFSPLKMGRTGFFSDLSPSESNLAKAYLDKPGSQTNEFITMTYEDIRLTRSLDEAAGGLFSSISEMSNYLIMQLSDGKFDGTTILTPQSIHAMQKRQFVENYPNAAFSGFYGQTASGYGYGFAIDENFYGTKLVQHSGSFIGASAWVAMMPEHDRGVVMLSNHHPSPRIFAQAILAETLGKDSRSDWPLLKLRDHQKSLSGIYHGYKGLSKIKVKAVNNQLVLSPLDDSNPVVLFPIDNDPYTHNYYIPTPMAGKDPVQFVSRGETTWLYQERNKWKKVAEL